MRSVRIDATRFKDGMDITFQVYSTNFAAIQVAAACKVSRVDTAITDSYNQRAHTVMYLQSST